MYLSWCIMLAKNIYSDSHLPPDLEVYSGGALWDQGPGVDDVAEKAPQEGHHHHQGDGEESRLDRGGRVPDPGAFQVATLSPSS